MYRTIPWFCLLFACIQPMRAQQIHTLNSSIHHSAEEALPSAALSPRTEIYAGLRARLTWADGTGRGEVWLTVFAESSVHSHLTLRIPLSSTGDAYGESRSCTVTPAGDELTFTAGLDEGNFVPFAPAASAKQFHLLLNKYLCRALAAPFHCGGRTVTLTESWTSWRLGRAASIELSSDLPAQMEVETSAVQSTGIAFDRARCAVVAPSNGICCVAGKTTQWHCGGLPVGRGWHQVSGDCFHRETGGSCKDQP
jgi:hypothetical protein